MSNQEDFICDIHRMDFRELLGFILEHPYFLTDGYFTRIRNAIDARYAELTRDIRSYYSF